MTIRTMKRLKAQLRATPSDIRPPAEDPGAERSRDKQRREEALRAKRDDRRREDDDESEQ
jgi:hypothetical protein